MVTGDKYW